MDNQRINIWELKLLDLTMGNALINTKYGANCMQAVEQDGSPCRKKHISFFTKFVRTWRTCRVMNVMSFSSPSAMVRRRMVRYR